MSNLGARMQLFALRGFIELAKPGKAGSIKAGIFDVECSFQREVNTHRMEAFISRKEMVDASDRM